jgi:electron transport complex protein RnfG
MEKNRFIHFGAVLLIIAAISAGILGTVNSLTSTVIAENARKAVNLARTQVLPSAQDFKENDAKIIDNLEFIPGINKNGEIVGYVVSVLEPGYAGNIDFVLGINNDGIITGLNVINHQETPGLGSKIMQKEWQELWVGRNIDYKFNKSVDGFVGATISPQSVYNGIIRALKAYNSEVKK